MSRNSYPGFGFMSRVVLPLFCAADIPSLLPRMISFRILSSVVVKYFYNAFIWAGYFPTLASAASISAAILASSSLTLAAKFALDICVAALVDDSHGSTSLGLCACGERGSEDVGTVAPVCVFRVSVGTGRYGSEYG